MNPVLQSEHFVLHPLAEGVYAAIATEMGAGYSNAGLVDLGDQTLVFDTFENPQAAEDLLKASIQLTRRHPAVVVISHLHPDHWGGAQVFAGSTILATHATRQAMLPFVEEILDVRQDPSELEEELRETETQLAAETDPQKRHSIQVSIARQRHGLQALPTLEPTLPNQTFGGKLIFHGAKRSAELSATGKGHTKSDCILCLPQEGIAFIGDLGFFQSQPFTPYGFPSEWVTLLRKMITWDIQTFVPGHGPLGGRDDLALEAAYLQAVEDMIQQIIRAGGTVEDALSQTLPSPFDGWQAVGRRFETNVRASYRRQSRKERSDPR